jgi:chitinase
VKSFCFQKKLLDFELQARAKKIARWLSSSLMAATCLFSLTLHADLWCTAYYPGWEQGSMPASNIDFTVVTHVIHFSLVPTSNGSLNSSANGITSPNSADVVAKTHAAGRKVLISVGGGNSQTGFQGATSGANLSTFINNLTNFMASRGYDGIDLDWEQLDPSDSMQYTNFVNALRTAMNAITPRPLLTAAIASPPTLPPVIASIQSQFDQINLMTYDLSGAYPGWVTWFNAPIYDGGYRFPSTSGLVPSADGMITSVVNAGVPASKLGIGIAFYGWIWSGGTGTSTGGASQPRQSWTTAPSTSQTNFNAIMSTYYQPSQYHWDTSAQAAYLSIDNPGSANDKFISYDDQRTCQSKVSYARNRGLGGVMIWELAQDHHANQPDPLLQAVKQALATPGTVAIQLNVPDIYLSFTSAPLGFYNVQWTSNLNSAVWNTLVVTNVVGTGGVMQVTDPGAVLNQPDRFYRVRTPP